jgi:hypothetical protein
MGDTHDMSYYGKCMIGGLLACGLTHAAITPLDVVKCKRQVKIIKRRKTKIKIISQSIFKKVEILKFFIYLFFSRQIFLIERKLYFFDEKLILFIETKFKSLIKT